MKYVSKMCKYAGTTTSAIIRQLPLQLISLPTPTANNTIVIPGTTITTQKIRLKAIIATTTLSYSPLLGASDCQKLAASYQLRATIRLFQQ